jgi:hypothetical protein
MIELLTVLTLTVSGVVFLSTALTSNASVAYNTLPGWWSGKCNKDHIKEAKLVGTWRRLQVCEPGLTGIEGKYGDGASVPLFHSTELVARYMYAAHRFSSVVADGRQVVDAYTAAHPNDLHRIYNDKRMALIKIMPQKGDVISFAYDSKNPGRYPSAGHVAIVGSVDKINTTKGSEIIHLVEQNYQTGTARIGRIITVTNWLIDDTVVDWMTERSLPGIGDGGNTDPQNQPTGTPTSSPDPSQGSTEQNQPTGTPTPSPDPSQGSTEQNQPTGTSVTPTVVTSDSLSADWVDPIDEPTYDGGTRYQLKANVYPTHSRDTPVDQVIFYGYWNSSWHELCEPTPDVDGTRTFSCLSDFRDVNDNTYPPPGKIQLKIVASNTEGKIYNVGKMPTVRYCPLGKCIENS